MPKKETEPKKNEEANVKKEVARHSEGDKRNETKSEGREDEEGEKGKKKAEIEEGREEWKRMSHDIRHIVQMMEGLLFAFWERRMKKKEERRRRKGIGRGKNKNSTERTNEEIEGTAVAAGVVHREDEEEEKGNGMDGLRHGSEQDVPVPSPMKETEEAFSTKGGSSTAGLRCPPPPLRPSSRHRHRSPLDMTDENKTSNPRMDACAAASSPSPPRTSISPPSSSFFGACPSARPLRRKRSDSGEVPAAATLPQEKMEGTDHRLKKKKRVELRGRVCGPYSSLHKDEEEELKNFFVPPITTSFVSSFASFPTPPAAIAGGEVEEEHRGGEKRRKGSERESEPDGAYPLTRRKGGALAGHTPPVDGDEYPMKNDIPAESAGLLLANSQNKTALALYQEIYETDGIDDDDILFL